MRAKLFLLLLVFTINIAGVSKEIVCPTYKKTIKTIITSSKYGQISDTGWLDAGADIVSCDSLPDPEPNCTTTTIPGSSLGEGDETITTCIYIHFSCSKDCSCTASTVVTEASITLPKFDLLKGKLEAAARMAPMIKKFELSVTAGVSKKLGEECCSSNPLDPPIKYQEYSGTVSLSLTAEFNIPGWSWSVNSEIEGIYRVKAELSLGPTITLTPSASGTVTGKSYDGKVCPGCVTTSISASLGGEIKFGGKAEADVSVFEGTWLEMSGRFEISAELGVNTNISGSAIVNWEMCPSPGWSGSLSWGGLTGTAKATINIRGTDLTVSKSVTLMDGGTRVF